MARRVRSVFVNRMKWLHALALVALGFWASSLVGDSLLYRVLVVLGALVMAAVVLAQTDEGRAFMGLLRDARTEIRKVVWPTHQEAMQTLLMVLIFVVLVALLLWGLDGILGWLAGFLIG